jgi:hypothetical protein
MEDKRPFQTRQRCSPYLVRTTVPAKNPQYSYPPRNARIMSFDGAEPRNYEFI